VNVVVALALVVAAASDAPVVTGAAGDTPVFTRDEPNLAAGRRALLADDVDTAIERFRRAATSTDTERAVVEYDVGQALTMRALAAAKAAQHAAPAGASPGDAGPPAPPPPPDVEDAIAAFDRAATLAREPRLVSEARLAAGNAALVGGKLDDAIGQLRRALVADPRNERARRNLQRALTMKQQQPPPPPQEGGDGDQKDGDKKDGEQKDGQQQQHGDKKDGQQQQDGDKKDGQQQQDGDKKDGQQQDGDKKDGQQQQDGDKKDDQQQQDGDKKDEQPQPADGEDPKKGQAPAPKPKPTSKEEARRLLQGLRSRERPLSPLEMRGTEQRPPATAGKDW